MQKWWSILFGAVILAEVIAVVITPPMGWGLPRNVASYGDEVDNLFHLILAVTGLVFVVVEGVLVYYMYRYAAEPGRKPLYVHGNHRLELAWTLVPAVVLLYIAFAQIGAWERIKYQSRTPDPDQIVEVSARQFEWRIRYPQNAKPSGAEEWSRVPQSDDVHVVNELHIWKRQSGQSANVKVYLKTRDVIHSFFLPHLRIKQDALPGKVIPVWFQATESNGEWNDAEKKWVYAKDDNGHDFVWDLACAELCGWGHYKMQGRLFVHPDPANYEKWLKHATAEEHRRVP